MAGLVGGFKARGASGTLRVFRLVFLIFCCRGELEGEFFMALGLRFFEIFFADTIFWDVPFLLGKLSTFVWQTSRATENVSTRQSSTADLLLACPKVREDIESEGFINEKDSGFKVDTKRGFDVESKWGFNVESIRGLKVESGPSLHKHFMLTELGFLLLAATADKLRYTGFNRLLLEELPRNFDRVIFIVNVSLANEYCRVISSAEQNLESLRIYRTNSTLEINFSNKTDTTEFQNISRVKFAYL